MSRGHAGREVLSGGEMEPGAVVLVDVVDRRAGTILGTFEGRDLALSVDTSHDSGMRTEIYNIPDLNDERLTEQAWYIRCC
jgi:hypothetical protein